MAKTTEDFSSAFGNWNTSLVNNSLKFDDINNEVDFYGEVDTYWMSKVINACG